jgi:hypothetical protein
VSSTGRALYYVAVRSPRHQAILQLALGSERVSQPKTPGNQDHGDRETSYRSPPISAVTLLWSNHLDHQSPSGHA